MGMENSVETKTPQDLAVEAGEHYQRGEFLIAANIFAAAENGFHLKEDHLNAAEMANNRSVAFLQAGRAQAALKAVTGTAEIFASQHDELRQAMAYGNQAAALEALKEYNAALQAYEASAELLKKVNADELRMDVMKSLSALQLKTGQSLQALATMQAGVDGLKKPKMKHHLLQRLLHVPAKLMNR